MYFVCGIFLSLNEFVVVVDGFGNVYGMFLGWVIIIVVNLLNGIFLGSVEVMVIFLREVVVQVIDIVMVINLSVSIFILFYFRLLIQIVVVFVY